MNNVIKFRDYKIFFGEDSCAGLESNCVGYFEKYSNTVYVIIEGRNIAKFCGKAPLTRAKKFVEENITTYI